MSSVNPNQNVSNNNFTPVKESAEKNSSSKSVTAVAIQSLTTVVKEGKAEKLADLFDKIRKEKSAVLSKWFSSFDLAGFTGMTDLSFLPLNQLIYLSYLSIFVRLYHRNSVSVTNYSNISDILTTLANPTLELRVVNELTKLLEQLAKETRHPPEGQKELRNYLDALSSLAAFCRRSSEDHYNFPTFTFTQASNAGILFIDFIVKELKKIPMFEEPEETAQPLEPTHTVTGEKEIVSKECRLTNFGLYMVEKTKVMHKSFRYLQMTTEKLSKGNLEGLKDFQSFMKSFTVGISGQMLGYRTALNWQTLQHGIAISSQTKALKNRLFRIFYERYIKFFGAFEKETCQNLRILEKNSKNAARITYVACPRILPFLFIKIPSDFSRLSRGPQQSDVELQQKEDYLMKQVFSPALGPNFPKILKELAQDCTKLLEDTLRASVVARFNFPKSSYLAHVIIERINQIMKSLWGDRPSFSSLKDFRDQYSKYLKDCEGRLKADIASENFPIPVESSEAIKSSFVLGQYLYSKLVRLEILHSCYSIATNVISSHVISHSQKEGLTLRQVKRQRELWQFTIDLPDTQLNTKAKQSVAIAAPVQKAQKESVAAHSSEALIAVSSSICAPFIQPPRSSSEMLHRFNHYLSSIYGIRPIQPSAICIADTSSHTVSVYQQHYAVDAMKWVAEMITQTQNPTIGVYLINCFSFWRLISGEQGLTAEWIRKTSGEPTHSISQMRQSLALPVHSSHYDEDFGTIPYRYPFHCDRDSHTALETTETELKKLVEEFKNNLSVITKRILEKQFEVLAKHASADMGERVSSLEKMLKEGIVANLSEARIKETSMSFSHTKQLHEMQGIFHRLLNRINESIHKLADSGEELASQHMSLGNAFYHVQNLHRQISLMLHFPQQRYLCIHAQMTILSAQYAIENLGVFLSLQQNDELRTHNLRTYHQLYGLGQHLSEVDLKTLDSLNIQKGTEYPYHYFATLSASQVSPLMQYLSNLYITSRLHSDSCEIPIETGIRNMSLSDMHQEFIDLCLQPIFRLVSALIESHCNSTPP